MHGNLVMIGSTWVNQSVLGCNIESCSSVLWTSASFLEPQRTGQWTLNPLRSGGANAVCSNQSQSCKRLSTNFRWVGMDCSNVVCKTLRSFVCRLPDRFRLNRESMWSPISIKFLVKKSKIHHWHMLFVLLGLYHLFSCVCFSCLSVWGLQVCLTYTPRREDSMIGDLLIEHFIFWNICTGRQPLQMFLGKVFCWCCHILSTLPDFCWNWGILLDNPSVGYLCEFFGAFHVCVDSSQS